MKKTKAAGGAQAAGRKTRQPKSTRKRAPAAAAKPNTPPVEVVLDNTIPGGFRMEPVNAR